MSLSNSACLSTISVYYYALGEPDPLFMLKYMIHNWERKLARRDNNRVVRPFEWGIEYLDYGSVGSANGHSGNGAGHDARATIFQFNERAIAESHRFFQAPYTPRFSFDGQWLTFQSTVTTPFAENNTAHARYFPVPAGQGIMNGARDHEVDRARGR